MQVGCVYYLQNVIIRKKSSKNNKLVGDFELEAIEYTTIMEAEDTGKILTEYVYPAHYVKVVDIKKDKVEINGLTGELFCNFECQL